MKVFYKLKPQLMSTVDRSKFFFQETQLPANMKCDELRVDIHHWQKFLFPLFTFLSLCKREVKLAWLV